MFLACGFWTPNPSTCYSSWFPFKIAVLGVYNINRMHRLHHFQTSSCLVFPLLGLALLENFPMVIAWSFYVHPVYRECGQVHPRWHLENHMCLSKASFLYTFVTCESLTLRAHGYAIMAASWQVHRRIRRMISWSGFLNVEPCRAGCLLVTPSDLLLV